MKVGLFIPCYVDQFYPQVGKATFRLLQHFGMQVSVPLQQTCCGQPMANSGFECESVKTLQHQFSLFADCEYIVAPSASCIMHIREMGEKDYLSPEDKAIAHRFLDFTEFMHRFKLIDQYEGQSQAKVVLHKSCHGLRGMGLGQCSESMTPADNLQLELLKKVEGIQMITPNRADECCGFGGTFAVSEEAISVRMGRDRLQDYISSGAEIITSGDMSCMMHLEGIIKREKLPVKVKHLAEILFESVHLHKKQAQHVASY
ncbi:(Fe-S)-binding protein [Persicobacter psychrovividus]